MCAPKCSVIPFPASTMHSRRSGPLRYAQDVATDEGSPESGNLFWILDAGFPFENRPALIVKLGKLAENRTQVDLSFTQRAKSPWPFDPTLIAAISEPAADGAELCILYMESSNERMVKVNELKIIDPLHKKMAGIIKYLCPCMLIDEIEKPLVCRAIMNALSRVKFEAYIDSSLVEGVEDWNPA